ncbi:glycosyltransferase family 4 protein [Pontibacter ramchanderi]|uniref:Glycosyltransferase involved in cell wall biosynthesis n=1 Tax=Pontibacter ramchanderi TaxID=1179743 RepID=A0A2N3V1M0_9BACT|nr:glycosyltransferase family 4 protein [Pontibacter ramchanderi]PKV75529.1 glycosyltransferase involved in cell wall biosynthesis [Pontibacter ramchanderi]
MVDSLLIFDTHPVQYRVPVWQAIEALKPGRIRVIYASDCSVRGYRDNEFGERVVWDEPLLEGYSFSILNCVNGEPLTGWNSLTGEGVREEIDKFSPSAILLTGFNYKYDFIAYKEALLRKIPIWIRCECQDEAFVRSNIKSFIRFGFYSLLYSPIKKFFYIGELNRLHYIKHGAYPQKLRAASYCTVDKFKALDHNSKSRLRSQARSKAGIKESDLVIGFSGKFITKKNPCILYKMLNNMPSSILQRLAFYFIGSGELEGKLKSLGQNTLKEFGIKSHFTGFVNQSQLTQHYLAIDILVLPSQRMGETWGLVANEALQAGCGVIVSDAVGCSVDFGSWDRVKVFKENNADELAKCIVELSHYSRDFDWAKERIGNYSVDAVAVSIANELA